MSHGGTSWVPGPTLKAVQGTSQRESCTAFPTAFWWEVLLLSSQLPLAALLLASGSKGPALISERWLWDWLPSPCLGMWGAAGGVTVQAGCRVDSHLFPSPAGLRGTLLSFHPSICLSIRALPGSLLSCFRGPPLLLRLKQDRRGGWLGGQAEGMNEQGHE